MKLSKLKWWKALGHSNLTLNFWGHWEKEDSRMAEGNNSLLWAWLHRQEEKADMDYNKVQSAHGSTDVLTCSSSLITILSFCYVISWTRGGWVYIWFWFFSPAYPFLCCRIVWPKSLFFPVICCFPLIALFHVSMYQKAILTFLWKLIKNWKLKRLTQVYH